MNRFLYDSDLGHERVKGLTHLPTGLQTVIRISTKRELDESLLGEAKALEVINKINGRLYPFTEKTNLTPYLKRLLCNALIQPHFGYSCSA